MILVVFINEKRSLSGVTNHLLKAMWEYKLVRGSVLDSQPSAGEKYFHMEDTLLYAI